MEPVSPASEINHEEYFDALSIQRLQHARNGSRSSSTHLASSLWAGAPALPYTGHHHHYLQQQHQQQSQQSSPVAAQTPRSSPRTAAHRRNTLSSTSSRLEPGGDLPGSPSSLRRRQLQERAFGQRRSSLLVREEAHAAPIYTETSSDHIASRNDGVDVSQQILCDTGLSLPLDPITTATTNPHDLVSAYDTDARNDRHSQLHPGEDYTIPEKITPTIELPLTPDSARFPTEHSSLHRDWRRSLPAHHGMEESSSNDFFLELAEDAHNTRGGTSLRDKRRSLPPTNLRASTSADTQRPRTSGGPSAARPGTRLDEVRSNFRQRQIEHEQDDTGSVTSFGGLKDSVTLRPRRSSRYNAAMERQPASPLSPTRQNEVLRSPDMSIFGRNRALPGQIGTKQRRSSQLAVLRQESEGDSPAESSEPKQSILESVSAESQTAPSTVWDELDDLKSRLKKLELTGKLPPTSGAAITAGSSPQLERPRTATTAPTTIDSSPKRDKQSAPSEIRASTDGLQPATPVNLDSHPLLHTALAKAKTLLSPALYRSLEATAADALQLASMAGGVGPNAQVGSSAMSVVNGGSTIDRALRRKADSMCRNLTELCLALCDGKHEAPSMTASPLSPNLSSTIVPSGRTSRMSAVRVEAAPQGGRAMSRLEARRSSILGGPSPEGPRIYVTPRRDADDASTSEQEGTPSQQSGFDRQRFIRSSSRLTAPRPRYEELSGDEDPTVRPSSRAGSEYSFRSKRSFEAPASVTTPYRSFSLREAITNRRASGQGIDGHRELTRVASMSSDVGRRRWTRESTPPVLEENIGEHESEQTASQPQPQPQPQPRQSRLATLGHMKFGPRRVFTDAAARSLSLSRRERHVAVE